MSRNVRAIPPPSQFWDGTHALCPYCKGKASYVTLGDRLYPYREDFGGVWACSCPARAHTGCHPRTALPLGRLADPALRRAKQAAHAAFDPLWRSKAQRKGRSTYQARLAGYAWLAEQLGIPQVECHIGWFDVEQCARVVAICAEFYKRKAA